MFVVQNSWYVCWALHSILSSCPLTLGEGVSGVKIEGLVHWFKRQCTSAPQTGHGCEVLLVRCETWSSRKEGTSTKESEMGGLRKISRAFLISPSCWSFLTLMIRGIVMIHTIISNEETFLQDFLENLEEMF